MSVVSDRHLLVARVLRKQSAPLAARLALVARPLGEDLALLPQTRRAVVLEPSQALRQPRRRELVESRSFVPLIVCAGGVLLPSRSLELELPLYDLVDGLGTN